MCAYRKENVAYQKIKLKKIVISLHKIVFIKKGMDKFAPEQSAHEFHE